MSPMLGTVTQILGLILAALLSGAIFDAMPWTISVALMGYLIWQLYQAHRFSKWLESSEPAQTPANERNDIWNHIYRQVYQIRRRSQRRKQRLSDLLERYETSAAALPDGVVALRSDHSIGWFNRAAGEWLGLGQRDLGQRIDNLVRYPAFIRYLQAERYDEQLKLVLPGRGDLVLSMQIIPYGGDQYLLVARDISQIHRMEVMRRDFVANASHELRTPLTVFAGYLETLIERFQDHPSLGPALIQMQRQTSRMRQLIQDLLQISRLETLEPGQRDNPVNVPMLLERILSETRSLSNGAHTIDSDEIDTGLWLVGNEQDLYSAFANLLSNAVQYTPSGGRVTASWQRVNGGCQFAVSDTGIGIPSQHISRLTERFYRVDPGRSSSVGGTGLGLSIVKHVLRLHQASLSIESVPGEGSRFICRFPENRTLSHKQDAVRTSDTGE
ncbi:MAG: phosphate regulon sensor histidine kinase PhoR [Gammaproteobacteria bacterium]|nr:phosphate regulon sensor histidine kinase PhoR [Gammaproteobacteria bacterium]